MADEKPDTPFLYKLMKPRLKKEPIGTVLIIGYLPLPTYWDLKLTASWAARLTTLFN
jgi:hypothetical protein